uniref:Putative dynein assembly factor 5 axonemal n=1 Tax=Culex tarsalis TaxID=7177 RepID=A0A1Q3FK44_CULTA
MPQSDLKPLIESFCTNVQSPERMVRQRALKELLELVHKELPPEQAPSLFDETYLHILRCYADRFEMVRNLAITLVSELLAKLPPNDFYLGYIVPVVTRRLGQPETIEDSEEVRLQLLEQLEDIVRKYADPDGTRGDPLLKSYDSLVDILAKTLRDPFPAAQKKSCELVQVLAESTPSMHYRAEALVGPAGSALKHRHSANRIAAIEALGQLALHIHSNSDCAMRIIVDVSPLLMDSVPFVRRACGRVGCMMLVKLRDRYSLFSRILPLVLNCLTDDTPEVREDILARWKEAGELYYTENETELSKAKLIDKTPPNYPAEYERPTLPCRAIVQRSLAIVNLVLHEMEEWKEDIRLHATKLLKLVVLHAEKAFSTLFMETNPVLSKTCMDSDKEVAAEALRVAQLCGILLEYDTWSKHALVEFKKFHTLGHLRCLKAMYETSGLDKLKDLTKIAGLLTDSEICHQKREDYQTALLDFCDVLAADFNRIFVSNEIEGLANEKDRFKTENHLYTIILKVAAISFEDSILIRDRALQILTTLNRQPELLHSTHLVGVLATLDNLESANSDDAESIMLLAGIVFVCGFRPAYHRELCSTLAIALRHAIPQGQIKLFSSISIAMLRWSDTMAEVSGEDQLKLVRAFIEELIAPYLVWAAGRSAESIRAMATACLCSMSQGVDRLTFTTVLPAKLGTLVGLIDDNSIPTRAYALRTLLAMGPLDFEQLKPLAFAIMARLDDPSGEVRELAATCLGRLNLASESAADEASRWDDVLRQIVPTMFLHLENPELKLRKAILASLAQLLVHHRALIKGLANEVAAGCPYKKDLDEILAHQ